MKAIAKLTAVLAAGIIALTVQGCKDVNFISLENNGENYTEKSYAYSNEDETRTITVLEGETMEVSFDITSNNGELDMSLTKDGGAEVYSGSSVPTSTFTVKMNDPGDYLLDIEPNGHSGSYKISWDVVE